MKKVLALALTLALLSVNFALAEAPAAVPSITIYFSENPTTGYEWTCAVADPAIVAAADGGYVANPNPSALEGAGGRHSWTLTGLSEGDTQVTFAQSQNWEGGATSVTLVYNYHVDADKNITATVAEGVPEAFMADRAAVLLNENPTTGYEWTYKLSADGILAYERDEYDAPEDTGSGAVGQGGVHMWVFTGVAEGDVTITFDSARSWEKDVKPDATVTYTFHVDKDLFVTLTAVGGDYDSFDAFAAPQEE